MRIRALLDYPHPVTGDTMLLGQVLEVERPAGEALCEAGRAVETNEAVTEDIGTLVSAFHQDYARVHELRQLSHRSEEDG